VKTGLNQIKTKKMRHFRNKQKVSSTALFANFVSSFFPCFLFFQVRFYPRNSNLDNAFAVSVKLPAPAFLVNVFRDLLLVYCSDCRIVFYSMERIKSSSTGEYKGMTTVILQLLFATSI
jgi:hypothetical protein